MMISPETFYEYNLKGKTAEQIMSVIRNLKREMGRLKNVMENPNYADRGIIIHPAEDVQLYCAREYLLKAKEALEKAGGTYTPSAAEQKVAQFDASIPYINKIVFSIGGYFGGYETKTYTFSGDNIYMNLERSLDFEPDHKPEPQLLEMTKQEFLEEFKDLHIGEWRKHYNLKRFGWVVMDGTQWDLEIYFSNDHKPVKIYGDNAYPYNFENFADLFDIEFSNNEYYEEEDE